jgi:voltage-dependent potassium channel beta subunit
MKYRRLGDSGLKVSAISIGGWLTAGGSVEEETFHQIIRASVEGGINFIDVADIYARGAAETVLGRVLPEFKRSDLVISSKVFWPMSDNVNDRGLSRKHIMESVDKSLQRLGTDYLDIYFCHRADPETPLRETVRAMDDLVRQGKILYWGTSVWSAELLQQTYDLCNHCGYTPPITEQPLYNLLDRGIERDVMPRAQQLGMGLVVWSPLSGGLLTGKYNDAIPAGSRATTTTWLDGRLTPDTLHKTRALSALAADLGLDPGQLALAWALTRPAVASVITGATSPKHVQSNLAAASLDLDEATLRRLEEIFPA